MFFDNLAGIVERHLPEFVGLLREARIFRLEARDPNRAAGEIVEQWRPDERTIENFRLPFRVVAFEEASARGGAATSCIVLWTISEADRELGYLTGQGSRRETFIATGTLTGLPNVEQTIEPDNMDRVVSLRSMRAWTGCKKTGVRSAPASLLWIDPMMERVDRLVAGDKMDRILAKYGAGDPTWEQDLEEVKADLEQNRTLAAALRGKCEKLEVNLANLRCGLGVLSILVVNEPASFIVEERPLFPPRHGDTKTVRRSADRPHYIVLKPRQIRQRFLYENEAPEPEEGEENGERHKVAPHERRGHFRQLRSERFKNARGQVLWIKPMWVGPSEAIRGPNKYTVRLDL